MCVCVEEKGPITSTDCDSGKEAWRVPVIKMKNCIRFLCEYVNVDHVHTNRA